MTNGKLHSRQECRLPRFLLFVSFLPLAAQNASITGTVSDPQQEPIPNVSVTLTNVAGHYGVAWANTEADTSCTAGGKIVSLFFEFDGCDDPTGCFRLNALKLVDADGVQDTADVLAALPNLR